MTRDNRFDREQPKERRWMLLSLLFHVVAIVLLIVFTPVGRVLLESTKPKQADLALSQQRARELAEQIRKLNVEDLQKRLEDMQHIDQQMEQMRVEQRSTLTAEQIQPDAQAPRKALDAMNKTLEQMKQSHEVMQKNDAAEPVAQQLKQVESAQDEATTALMSAGMQYDPVRRAQKQANVKQLEVDSWQQQAEQLAQDITDQQQRAQRLQQQIDNETEHQIKPAQQRIEQTAQNIQQTQQKLDDVQKQLADAKSQLSQTKADDHNAMRRAQSQVKNAESQAKRLQSSIERDRKTQDSLQKKVESHQAKVADIQKTLAEAQQKQQQDQQDREHAKAQRQTAQDEAKTAQAAAKDLLQQVMSQPADAVAQANSQASQPQAISSDPAELFDQGRALEEKITDSYREVRAAELAKIQNMKLAEAMSRVDVPLSVRAPIDKQALQTNVRTGKALQNYKHELRKVDQQVLSMQMSAESMLAAAQQVKQGYSSQLTSAMTVERQRQLDQLALENSGQNAIDLTGVMSDKTGGGQGGGVPGAGSGGQPKANGDLPPGDSSGEKPKVAKAEPVVPHVSPNFKPLPGRTVGVGGVKTDWMSVQTWWMVGPFANPQRKNIHRHFAPETVVDLDGVYTGEGGRPIRWQFVQSDGPFVAPPGGEYEYSIWYAYTEIRFDKPTVMWIAVGSDDRSDLWINGQKVWASVDQLKPWRIDEGYRRVRFAAGVNRILCRVENGWHVMGFSLLLHTGPQAEDAAANN